MIKISGTVWYSFFNALGYLVAAIIFYREAKRKQYSVEILLYIVFGALLGGLIGSRLGSALFVYRAYYAHHLSDLCVPHVGGKTLVGGLIGGYFGAIIAKKIMHFNRSTGDLFAPGLAIGIAIGRIGCFLNGCCYGTPTRLPWGIPIQGVSRHPTQLYESVFCFFLFIFLLRMRAKVRREGDLFLLFLFCYSFFRFWIEFLREDRVMTALNISLAQAIAAVIVFICGVHFFRQKGNTSCVQ